MSEVNLTIDGQKVTVPKGTLIVEAARKLGIEIPVYCYHPKMEPLGACRVCVVNVEGARRPLLSSCATEVAEGMVVHTRDKAATEARESVLELLLANHPLDCPVCDRGGECDLQDFTMRYGPGKSRFREEKRHFDKSVRIGRDVVLDRERCIMCTRCVRFCSEVALDEGLTIIERGTKSCIGTFPGRSFDSQFSGNTVELCPVGALTSHTYRFKSRPWELQNYASVCNHCSVGCNLTVDVRYDQVARFRSRPNDKIDDGWLCDHGRYGYRFVHSPERLMSPRVRRNGQLVEASWEEALLVAKEGLKRYPASQVGAVAGPRLSNEAGWQLLRLVRGLLGSGNLDHRRGQAWTKEDGNRQPLPLSARLEGLDAATAVVLVRCNPSQTQPVLELRIKKAISRLGAGLVVVGEGGGLDRCADVKLDNISQLLDALAAHVSEPAPGVVHPGPRPWEAGGHGSADPAQAAAIVKRSSRVVIICDENSPFAGVAELAEAAGCLGQAPFGILMCLAGANSMGLRQNGVLPAFAPGWQRLKDAEETFREAWGAFSTEVGADYASMVAGKADLKALLLMAEDTLETRPEFLAVVDMFLGPAAQQADVVLPACSFLEQAQTLTSMDGTLQLCRQALPPLVDTMPDWKILLMLAEAMGQTWETDTPAKIFAEMGRLNPCYAGASYADFSTPAQVHWSYPQQGRLGTPRADLSGIPVHQADATPWMPAPATGSRVERVARINMDLGTPPEVPGQEDPRRVAARLSLEQALESLPSKDRPGVARGSGTAPMPPGPSPADRYHQVGMQFRELPPPFIPPPAPPPPAPRRGGTLEEVSP